LHYALGERRLATVEALLRCGIAMKANAAVDKIKDDLAFEVGELIAKQPVFFPASLGIAYALLTRFDKNHPRFKRINTYLYDLLCFVEAGGYLLKKGSDDKLKLVLQNDIPIQDKNSSDDLMKMTRIKHLLSSDSEMQQVVGKLMKDAFMLPDSVAQGIHNVNNGDSESMFALFQFGKEELEKERAITRKVEEDFKIIFLPQQKLYNEMTKQAINTQAGVKEQANTKSSTENSLAANSSSEKRKCSDVSEADAENTRPLKRQKKTEG